MEEVFLLGIGGAYDGQRLCIDGEVLIGRDASVCQIVYSGLDKNISGVHCKVENMDGRIKLTDMGSTNGTFLDNGIRITPYEPQILENGQSFYLGDHGNTFAVYIQRSGEGGNDPEVPNVRDRAEGKGRGIAIAAMVLGIVSILLGFACLYWDMGIIIPMLCAVPGVVMGMYILCARLAGRKMALSGLICSVTILAVLIVSALLPKEKSIVGTWTYSDADMLSMGIENVLGNALEGSEFSPAVDALTDSFGLEGEFTITFAESGEIYINTTDGIALGGTDLRWENSGDGAILLKMEVPSMELSIPGVGGGTTFLPPINIAYRAEYKLKRDTLIMDFFGREITLERV